MLSRRHIRVKVMQALYMYYNDGEEKLTIAQLTKALDKNIDKLYDLYLYLLLFLQELGNFVGQYEEEIKSRYIPDESELKTSGRFYTNPILQKLMGNAVFKKTLEKKQIHWQGESDILRRIFLDLKNQDIYKEYMGFGQENSVLAQEVLLFVLKHYTNNLPVLHHHLEEQYFNWLDDKKIVMQMATKTIQQLATSGDVDDFLLPLSDNAEENTEYAHNLLKLTIEKDEELDKMISARTTKWEPHQVALIDGIILKMAVCEFLHFPSIPGKVTINEYIELAKNYSTPQSKKFVNGVLDAILKELNTKTSFIKK